MVRAVAPRDARAAALVAERVQRRRRARRAPAPGRARARRAAAAGRAWRRWATSSAQRGLYDDAHRARRARLPQAHRPGRARTLASPDVFRRWLAGKGRFRVRYPEHGHHVEADLSRQVLALIDGGRVQRIYPTSSGTPSTPTILGSFRVYSQDPGLQRQGHVHSSYFIRGYAIHGYAAVPIYPASHGCLRVPSPTRSRSTTGPIGDGVDVYP